MGANCHIAIEYRPTWNNQSLSKEWYVWAMQIAEARDYVLYSLLAKVRGSYDKSYDPRGLPSNVSDEVKVWMDTAADHSHTWLTPVEFYNTCIYYEQAIKADGYNGYNGYDGYDERLLTLASEWQALSEVVLVLSKHFGIKNVRVVMGFDS
jgi:hypothetical protein